MQDNRVAGMEYMPVGLSAEFIDKNRDTVTAIPENVKILTHQRKGLSFSFSFSYEGEDQQLRFVVPLIRYYGYKGTYTDTAGKRYSVKVNRSEKGLVSVELENITNGSIEISYYKTSCEWAGEMISILTICGIVGYCFRKKKTCCC